MSALSVSESQCLSGFCINPSWKGFLKQQAAGLYVIIRSSSYSHTCWCAVRCPLAACDVVV